MNTDSKDAVTYRSKDRIATITIDRAERMNRIDAAVVEGLHQAWRRFMASEEDRVAILTGAGDKAFTAGADLKSPPNNLYRAIPGVGVAVDKPVIGAVAGWVVGGGMVLTTMCDILIAADTARFSYPEVKVGFTGGIIANIASRIPHKIAMELLLVGEPIDAGAPTRSATSTRWCRRPSSCRRRSTMPAASPPPRRCPRAPSSASSPRRCPRAQRSFAGIARAQTDAIFDSEDWVEGRKAFAEKRPPDYRDDERARAGVRPSSTSRQGNVACEGLTHYSAASALADGASTTRVLKSAGETISSTSKSSEQTISRCLIIGVCRMQSPLRMVCCPWPSYSKVAQPFST